MASIKSKYPEFGNQTDKTDGMKRNINKYKLDVYKILCEKIINEHGKLIESSLLAYKMDSFSTFMPRFKQSYHKKTKSLDVAPSVSKTSIERNSSQVSFDMYHEEKLDTSLQVTTIIQQINAIKNIVDVNENINFLVNYLCSEIVNQYDHYIFDQIYTKYKDTVYMQILIDISLFKNELRTKQFDQLENKIKMLMFDVDNNTKESFIEQFDQLNNLKVNKTDGLEILKKILKIKEINQQLSDTIISIYQNK